MQETAVSNLLKPVLPIGIHYSVPFRITKNRREHLQGKAPARHHDGQTASEIEVPVASLPNDQVLALCDLQMTLEQHEEIRDLLADQREGVIDQAGRARLSDLLQLYDRYLLRKSEALKIAVQRGLRAPLGE